LLGEQGHVDEAIQELQGLLNGTPSDRDTELVIAQVFSQAKRFPEAEAAAQKALALSPDPDDQVRAIFILGSIYEREKKYDLAEEQFKKVLAVDPLNGPAANYLGYMLADRGVRLEESVRYIQKALETDPNNGAYLDSLGWAYFKMNKLDLAELNLEKAVRASRPRLLAGRQDAPGGAGVGARLGGMAHRFLQRLWPRAGRPAAQGPGQAEAEPGHG
jgi:tetratricopeptide (TPR) repeat protein